MKKRTKKSVRKNKSKKRKPVKRAGKRAGKVSRKTKMRKAKPRKVIKKRKPAKRKPAAKKKRKKSKTSKSKTRRKPQRKIKKTRKPAKTKTKKKTKRAKRTKKVKRAVKKTRKPAKKKKRTAKKVRKTKRVKKEEISTIPTRNYYVVNPEFEYFYELRDLILKSSHAQRDMIRQGIRSLGRIKLAIITGILLEKESPDPMSADLLIVADDLDRRKLRSFLKSLEADVGKEIKFAIMDIEEFKYRLGMFDRFIRVLLEGHHEVLIDLIKLDLQSP